MLVTRAVSDPVALLVIDQADRFKEPGLEQVRNVFEHGGIVLVLIGMPGIEKRLARYPLFYNALDLSTSFGLWMPERFVKCCLGTRNGCDDHPDDGWRMRLLNRLLRQMDGFSKSRRFKRSRRQLWKRLGKAW